MNEHLQKIHDFIDSDQHLSAEDKSALLKSVKDANNAFAITEFKLERTEKVKRTTAILLEETIEELEQKRKSVEAHNRELAIETALERVRARTMAMQHSSELADASFVLDSQVRALGIKTWGCAFNIYGENESTEWFSSEMGTLPTYKTPRENLFLRYYKAGENGAPIHIEEFSGDDCAAHYDYLCTVPIMGDALRKVIADGGSFPTRQIDHVVYFKYGYLLFITFEPVPEAHDTFIRFAKVFEQTYTRFLDLQKAEAQAREARVELSLERIRAKVTAMKESPELLDIVVGMRSEFVGLGHEAHYFWHMRWLPDIYEKAMTSGDGTRIGNVMKLPRHMHGNIEVIADWEQGNAPFVVYTMDTESAIDYVDKMIALGDFEQIDPKAPTADDIRHIGGLTFIMARTTHGEIGYSLPGVVPNPPAEDVSTLIRFAAVFDLAYRRFEDLKRSEKQIYEGRIELALERVRARTMAMQSSTELADAAAILFHQVKDLGVQTYTSGFNIWDEDQKVMISWMANPSGVINPPFHFPYNEYDQHQRFYDAWKNHIQFLEDDLEGERADEHYSYLRSFPLLDEAFAAAERKGIATPRRQVHNAVFFTYGYVLFVTQEPKPEYQNLFRRFGQVFEQTYTRFLDLKKAEAQTKKAEQDLLEIIAARKKAEDTLTELRATQTQLIQSEKMASLGELTAGIAHEIQNPLNFVNNFSDVSIELLDEMTDELDKGDTTEVKAIASDIKQNLEKIAHHGRRADSIVKGMLQHSRKSAGEKELTDVNALTDEFLRLAYHGLRAKNKSFNAKLITSFDENLPKASVIPQDIGRVLLNLFTNAFYATQKRKQSEGENFDPIVEVATSVKNNTIEIRVQDNGGGIPAEIIDKIFQPFFTTKPTGEGTGLGLSLSYDIVKAHAGALKVISKQGDGSEFTISLPCN